MRDTLVNRAKCPVKLLDLMALGRPIVAHARRPGGASISFTAKAACWCTPGDVAGLSAAVADLLADPARRARLGAAAAERAWTVFPWARLAGAAEAAYARALRRGQR